MNSTDCNSLLKKINITIEKRVNEYLKDYDVTLSQWRCLNYLYDCGGEHVFMKDIQEHFEVSRPTIAGILKRLAAKGYITIDKADYSANSKDVSLTPSGISICRQGLERKHFVDGLLTRPLNEQETEQFRQLLQKIYDDIKED